MAEGPEARPGHDEAGSEPCGGSRCGHHQVGEALDLDPGLGWKAAGEQRRTGDDSTAPTQTDQEESCVDPDGVLGIGVGGQLGTDEEHDAAAGEDRSGSEVVGEPADDG